MSVTSLTDARVVLLGGLIDHAPTFPPASLAPAAALAEDRGARASESSFMLGRLVWPASRLEELGSEERVLSLVLDGPSPSDRRVEAVETSRTADLAALVGLAGEVFVELPVDEELVDNLARLGDLGLHGKVRCGGASTPTVAELARFVRGCRHAGVAFKATAGLHHALRRREEHGFLNLLAAVVFGDEEAALAEVEPSAFALDAEAFRWRGREAGAQELARVRSEVFRSIGSCSFFEPLEELRSAGILPL